MNTPFDPSQLKTRRELLAIFLRAFVAQERSAQDPKRRKRQSAGPSEYVLIFDTETTTDPSQRLRFGCYQFWKGDTLIEAGLFFNPSAFSPAEQELLAAFARSRGLKCITKVAFVDDVFYGLAYDLRATIVGFNLPFDLSRLAVHHGPALQDARRVYPPIIRRRAEGACSDQAFIRASFVDPIRGGPQASRHEGRSKKAR